MLLEIKTFLIAMAPIGELRASIPIALNIYHLPTWKAYFFSVLGNMVPVVLILLTIETISKYLSRKIYFFNKFFTWLFNRVENHHKERVKKWKEFALIILVAIPLPFTGAWTGSLVAFVFRFPFKKSFSLIAFGVIIAGFIVVCLNYFGVFVEDYLGWKISIGLLFLIGTIWWIFKNNVNKNN